MPEFIPKTLAALANVRFFNWPGAGVTISETLGMTHAAVTPPGASIIHVGGQAGITAEGTVPSNLEDEITEAFSHIELSLREAGLTGSRHDVWGCVFRINSYHANTDETFAPTFLRVFKAHVGQSRPIFTGVDVAKLLRPDVHFEMEVQAVLPKPAEAA
ncbi:hypothetical protein B0J13DRAFT_625558 [Dactylonectria estremocensis]|uniref:Uncharacterized protein n=1 Tax=Dactylonectria estremocensis TaxID=1079267 RepID=A0A9P9EFI9_9HYPO|nr:hypothetical protein B0J13DRAFT_625558 [Dactylonectria estremocensis]